MNHCRHPCTQAGRTEQLQSIQCIASICFFCVSSCMHMHFAHDCAAQGALQVSIFLPCLSDRLWLLYVSAGPLYVGNLPPNRSMCLYQDTLQSVVVSHEGWNYTNEGTEAKPKKG